MSFCVSMDYMHVTNYVNPMLQCENICCSVQWNAVIVYTGLNACLVEAWLPRQSSACGAVGTAAVIDVLACLLMLSIHLASFRVSAPSLINEEHCVVVHDCPAKGLKVETEHWPSTPQPASLLPPGGSKETPPPAKSEKAVWGFMSALNY